MKRPRQSKALLSFAVRSKFSGRTNLSIARGLILLFLMIFVSSCATMQPVDHQTVVTQSVKVGVPQWMTWPTPFVDSEYATNTDLLNEIEILKAAVNSCNADKARISTWSAQSVAAPAIEGAIGVRHQ